MPDDLTKLSEEQKKERLSNFVKEYIEKIKTSRERTWEKSVQFLGYDSAAYPHWLDVSSASECFCCEAVSYLDAARQMAKQYFFLNVYADEYECWVAESDGLDGSQGHSSGYRFILNRDLEEIPGRVGWFE